MVEEAVGHLCAGVRGIVLGAEAAQAEAAEEAEVGSAVGRFGFVGEAGGGEVGEDVEVADVGEPWVVVDGWADETAEAEAAQTADPVAELDAVGLELQLGEEAVVDGCVSGADGLAYLLEQSWILAEVRGGDGELEGFVELIVDDGDGELDAEGGADESATPTAEPLADEVAVDDVGTADGGAEFFGVACVGGGYGLVEGSPVFEELAESLSGGLQFGDEVGDRDLVDGADPAAHEAIADGADPVAEEMTVGTELELVREFAEAGAVALVENCGETGDELWICGELDDRFGEEAGVGLVDGFGWAAEFEAEEDALLAADPLADEAAAGEEAELVERCLEGAGVGDAEGVVEGGEGFFVLADLGDGGRAFEEIAEDVELEALV